MIKETCPCGATIEVNHGVTGVEAADVERWRDNHRHEPAPRVPEWANDPDTYVLGEDYVFNGEGEPVWISNIHTPPPFWWQRVENQTLNKPLDVRPAEYDTA